LSTMEYEEFGKPHDLRTLEPAHEFWLNMLHIHGDEIMFDHMAEYPVQIINWHDQETSPSLSHAQAKFKGVVCGGLKRWDSMVVGTAGQVQRDALEAIRQTDGRRFILGTGCVLPIITPAGNIMAARKSVEVVKNFG
jgi:uroporphyrinogen decarboxylase